MVDFVAGLWPNFPEGENVSDYNPQVDWRSFRENEIETTFRGLKGTAKMSDQEKMVRFESYITNMTFCTIHFDENENIKSLCLCNRINFFSHKIEPRLYDTFFSTHGNVR